MPHYMIEANYTREGAEGIAAKGGTARREAIEQMMVAAGGQLEAFYYAFGEHDVFAIAELPNDETMASIALSIARSGSTQIKTTVLLTPEQIDAAADMAPEYRRPGT